MEIFFDVVLEGTTLPGFDLASVKAQLAALIKRNEDIASRLLSGHPTTLKSRVDAATGQRYVDTLRRVGASASLQPETLELDANLDDVVSSRPVRAPSKASTPVAALAAAHASVAGELSPEDYYKAAIGPKNQDFYLRYFARRDAGGSVVSWHWPAFFVSWYWLLTRKMWGLSWLYLGLALIPLLGQFLWAALAWVVFPMFANALYYRHVRNQIAEVRAASKDSATQLARLSARGGTSNVVIYAVIATVLVLVIGIVLGIVGGNFSDRGEEAKRAAAKIEIEQIGQTLDLFKLEVGRYPTQQEGLQALVTEPPGVSDWHGPYWRSGVVPKDPWGNNYVYIFPGQHGQYDIISHGPDGKGANGGNKDISSWQ